MALRTPLSVTPHLYMGDSTGRPLDKGVVYFGEQDKDPEFYPINLFSDDALTKPLAQPVHTKGGYLYDKGDMVEPHAKELIYSVKVLDSYGRKVFYKGAMMRNSWNDDVIEQINTAIIGSADAARQVAIDITNDAINNTAVEGGVLADTFVVVDGSLSQRTINKGLESIADLPTIKNPKDGLRVYVKSYHAGLGKGGGYFVYDSTKTELNDGGSVFNGWVRQKEDSVYTIDEFGAIEGSDATQSIIDIFSFIQEAGNSSTYSYSIYGSYSFTAPLDIDIQGSRIDFNATLTTANESSYGLKITGRNAYITGYLKLICGSSNSSSKAGYDLRRQDIGVIMGNIRSTSFLCDLYVSNVKHTGIEITSSIGNNNHSTFARLDAARCGTRLIEYNKVPLEINNFGATTSLSGYSLFKFNIGDIPDKLQPSDFIEINGQVLHVTDIDRDVGTVKAFPHVEDLSLTPCRFNIGSSFWFRGADSNMMSFDVLNSVGGPLGAKLGSFYGPMINKVHVGTGFAGVAITSGTSPSSYNIGGCIGYMYTESIDIDILQCTTAAINWRVLTSLGIVLGVFSIAPNLFPVKIDYKMKSEDDSVRFRELSLYTKNASNNYKKLNSALTTTNANDYFLIEKCAIDNGEVIVNLVINYRSTIGKFSTIEVSIFHAPRRNTRDARKIENGNAIASDLCVVNYEGEDWFALKINNPNTARYQTYELSSNLDTELKSAAADQVTFIEDLVYSGSSTMSLGDLNLQLDGKAIFLKNEEGAQYKISIDSTGAIIATPAD